MGLFDYIRCERELPAPNAQDLEYQTKDTPAQFMERYTIRADGTLWHEVYDTEDHSDPNAKGLMALVGCMSRVNHRWEPCPMTGGIDFYDGDLGSWVEFSSDFLDGNLQRLTLITDTRQAPTTPTPSVVGLGSVA